MGLFSPLSDLRYLRSQKGNQNVFGVRLISFRSSTSFSIFFSMHLSPSSSYHPSTEDWAHPAISVYTYIARMYILHFLHLFPNPNPSNILPGNENRENSSQTQTEWRIAFSHFLYWIREEFPSTGAELPLHLLPLHSMYGACIYI